MQFTLDMGEGANQIRSYQVGQIKINDDMYYRSTIVTPTAIIDWEPQHISELKEQHLLAIANMSPQVVLLGTGEKTTFLPNQLLELLTSRDIGVEVMTTAAACRTYNVLMAEGRNVLAALILS